MKCILTLLFYVAGFYNSCWGKMFVDDEGNSWQYQVAENGDVSIIGIPPVTNLVIPAYIESKPVVSLATSLTWYRFGERVSVKEIAIPSTLTNLGSWVFEGSDVSKISVDPGNPKYAARENVLYQTRWRDEYYREHYPCEWSLIWCGTEVTHLTIATNVTAFGWDTYRGRYDDGYWLSWDGSKLESIVVEEGNPIFSSVDGILYKGASLCRCPPKRNGTISIPAGVSSLESRAFHGCENLTGILVEDKSDSFSAFDGALYSKDYTQLLAVPGGRTQFEIAHDARRIVSASQSANLRTVVLPEGVESIDAGAFAYCGKLESIVLPESVSVIPYNCFIGCSSLTSIVLPVEIKSIETQAFARCSKLEYVNIPESVTNIGAHAFQECEALGSVVMKGDNITTVPECCFAFCVSLTSVVFSASLQSVGTLAFGSCYKLKSVNFPSTLEVIESNAFAGAGFKELMLSGAKLTVGERAFSSCAGLEVVNIDHSVKSIDPRAFVGCRSVSEYKLVDESAYYATTNRCLCDRKMEQLLFVPHTDTELFVPTGIVTIGSYACSSHENLKKIILPDSLERIEKCAFEDCLKLNDVTIPSGTTYIGNSAFENCSSIQYIDLPQSVLHLGGSCFAGCSSLAVVNLSTNLEEIGWSCFEGCGSLEEIVVPSKVATLENSTFSGCTNLKSCVIMKGVTGIASDVWRDCSSLTNLLIPSSVQELSGAFCGCSNLVSISFVGNAPDIYDGGWREFSTTDFNDTMGSDDCWTETIGSTTWYHYVKRISGYLFKGTAEDLRVYVKPGSSGWIDEEVTGIPEKWPVDSSNGRDISYDGTLEDPDIIYETRYKVPFKFMRLIDDEYPASLTRYWYVGDEIEIPDAMGQEKIGFSFRGWSDGVDAYRTGEKYTLKSGGVTFVPIWGSPTFTLRYDRNGGVGTMTNEECVVGAKIALQTNAFTMAEREFLGWGEKSDGPVKYANGQSAVEIRPLLEDEVVLYAIWSEAKTEIGDCLDCHDLDFITGGSSPWTGVSDVTHSPMGAMRSGCVTNGESVLSVTVRGEGQIGFWWRVSSEAYKTYQIDYVSFRVDGVEQSWMGGEIDWQHIVFDVVGDGQHTISWAYVKDDDGSAGDDCAWLDEVVWTPNGLPVDPIPDLGETPTANEVAAALEGSVDADLVKHITNGTEYAAYRAWAMNVKASDGSATAGLQAVHDSENAWLSYALQTDKLISSPPVQGDLTIDTFEPGATDGSFDLTVALKGVDIGSEASKENLKRIFGIEGSSSLSGAIFSSASVDLEFGAPSEGKVKCTVVPKDTKAKSFFIKMRMK